jgi:2-oxoglutarate ferredoxin oxidoreductase subunit gamma
MKEKTAARGELIVTGLGGAGVLTIGTLLAQAAARRYARVTWFPSYAISKRGGLCECTVVYSDEEIASPLLSQAEGVIVAEALQFRDFLGRVRAAGTMVVEKAGLESRSERSDITVIEVPAIQEAITLTGDSRGANLVLLGAYIEATHRFPPELVTAEIEQGFGGNKKITHANLAAFEKGRRLVINHQVTMRAAAL